MNFDANIIYRRRLLVSCEAEICNLQRIKDLFLHTRRSCCGLYWISVIASRTAIIVCKGFFLIERRRKFVRFRLGVC